MPIHWPTLYAQIERQIIGWQRHLAAQQEAVKTALAELAYWAKRGAEGVRIVQEALHTWPDLARYHRFAWPLDANRWDAGRCPHDAPPGPHGCPRPAGPPPGEVWAADGSQITPDRHAAVFFGLVNVGVVRMMATATPRVHTVSRLYLEPDLRASPGDATGFIAAERDLAEVRVLAEALATASDRAKPTLALVDGPLEFWRRGETGSEARQAYAKAVNRLQELGALPAGYVDRPLSRPLVNTLALLHAHRQGQLDIAFDPSEVWPGVVDAHLWARLLQPGQRSPRLRVVNAPPDAPTTLALAAFYLRLPRAHAVARVDVPLTLAQNPDAEALDALHAHLWHQVHIVPQHFYPYILLRAHETALVTYQERRTLESHLQRRLAEMRDHWTHRSDKQRLKDTTASRAVPRRGTP